MVKTHDVMMALSLAALNLRGDDEENTIIIPSVSEFVRNSFEVSFEEYYHDHEGAHDMGTSRYKIIVEMLE